MKIEMTALLEHNVCVHVPNGEAMNREELMEALGNEEYQVLWVENPTTSEVVSVAIAERGDAPFNTDESPLNAEEQQAIATGKPLLSNYN